MPGPADMYRLPIVKEILERLIQYRRRAAARLRGLPDLERLAAQGMQLGEGPHISQNVYIDGTWPWLISIGDFVTLGPHSAIIVHDTSLHQHTAKTRLGAVTIGNRVYVGVGAIILPGTAIGEDSVIGAGAVVHGEIPPKSLVTGNPATVSPIKGAVAWQLASAKRSHDWTDEATRHDSLTADQKRAQRDALAGLAAAYVPAEVAPNSPHQLANRS